MEDKKLLIRCGTCQEEVSDFLTYKEGDAFLIMSKNSIAGPSAFPKGYYSFPPEGLGNVSFLELEIPNSSYILSHDDLQAQVLDMEDFGCCGFTGKKGLNLACSNGHNVGVMISDCIYPQFAYFEKRHVEAIEIDKLFLDIIRSFFDKDILQSDYFQLIKEEGVEASFHQLLEEIKHNLKIPLTAYQLNMIRRYAHQIKYSKEALLDLELLNV